MSALHASVLNAFKKQSWVCREITGQEVVEADFEAYHGKVPVHVQSFGEAHILSVVATATLTVPATHRSRAAELIMRTNRELNVGSFEMDWDGGTVMFRQGNVFPKHRYDDLLIIGLVHNAVAEMDRLMPYLGELCRITTSMLPLSNIRTLLAREDLIPPVPEEPETAKV
jgi:hypothetical protein